MPPSVFRSYLKGWKPVPYLVNVFEQHALDRKKYRIYRSFGPVFPAASPANSAFRRVRTLMCRLGYEIDDYIKGTASCTRDGRRQVVRIGKVIAGQASKYRKIGRAKQVARMEEILKVFSSDPSRSASQQNTKFKIVFCRHPYDIAGKSTYRGWTSCMSIHGNRNNSDVKADIEHGTVEAYCVKDGDEAIKNPVCRVSLKPYVNLIHPEFRTMGVEGRVYGQPVPGFKKRVRELAEEFFPVTAPGVYSIPESVYKDEITNTLVIGKKSIVDAIRKTPEDFLRYPTNVKADCIYTYPTLIRQLGPIIGRIDENVWLRLWSRLTRHKAKRKAVTMWRALEYLKDKGTKGCSQARAALLMSLGSEYWGKGDFEDYLAAARMFDRPFVPVKFQLDVYYRLMQSPGWQFPHFVNQNEAALATFIDWLNEDRSRVLGFCRDFGWSFSTSIPSVELKKRLLSGHPWTPDEWYFFDRYLWLSHDGLDRWVFDQRRLAEKRIGEGNSGLCRAA